MGSPSQRAQPNAAARRAAPAHLLVSVAFEERFLLELVAPTFREHSLGRPRGALVEADYALADLSGRKHTAQTHARVGGHGPRRDSQRIALCGMADARCMC